MKRLYGLLIAIVALFVFVPLAAAADKDGDEHPVLRWDQQINTTSRFAVLSGFGGAAVRDNETGLVWEQSPSTSTFSWGSSQLHCNQLTTGGRLGWRLPTIQELASLVDPTQSSPSLPSGHPFSNVQSSLYWSATTLAGGGGSAWTVFFRNGVHDTIVDAFPETSSSYAWCVRGGQGVDAQ
jgi:hypothetical protein